MTFKHVKFEDSPTMRSLERVAREKGMIKPETLQKKASVTKKADYSPSSDLMENIFKLCSGLRTQGLEKEASEIENNYLNYKRAQTLYEVNKEKGEDLVQSAHPKGSHKLENVEGDEAVVEDIIDKHMKMLEVVNKKPTGKLSNARDILNEVKVALGVDFLGLKKGRKVSLGQEESSGVGTAAELAGGTAVAGGLGWLAKKLMGPRGVDADAIRVLKEVLKRNPTKEEINLLRKQIQERGIKEALNKVFGKATSEAVENTAEQVVKQVAEKAVQRGAGNVALEGAEVAGETALEAIPEVASIGSGVATGAIAVSALVGGAIGYFLFDVINSFSDFKKAGDHLTAELKDVDNDLSEQFNGSLSKIMSLYPSLKKLQSSTSPEEFVSVLPSIQKLSDFMDENFKLTQKIWYTAQNESGAGGTGGWWDAAKGLVSSNVSIFGGWSDVITASAEYMRLSQKINMKILDWYSMAKNEERKSRQKSVDQAGGSGVVDLNKNFVDLKNTVDTYIARLSLYNSSAATQLKNWLNQVNETIDNDKSEFVRNKRNSDPKILSFYQNKFQEAKDAIDAFEREYKI